MEAVKNSLNGSVRRDFKRLKHGCRKEKGIDSLPDPLLVHIISLLHARDAVTTSVLSRRWKCLWTYIPILDFNFYDFINEDYYQGLKGQRRFISFINYTMLLNQSPKIDKFKVHMDYMKSYSYDVDVWLRLAMGKNVQELALSLLSAESHIHLDFDKEDDDGSCYELPLYVLSNSSLTTFKLVNCGIKRHGSIQWNNLKALSLRLMSLSNDLIRDILSGSPSLESFEINFCHNYDYIDIKSERVKKLVISYYDFALGVHVDTTVPLRISAPNVKSLDISGLFNRRRISLINSSSSLIEAKVNFDILQGVDTVHYKSSHEMYPQILREFFEKILHIKDLTLGSWWLQALSMLDEKVQPYMLSECVCLSIDTILKEWELPGMAKLLASAPLLETLVVNMEYYSYSEKLFEDSDILKSFDCHGGNFWSSQKTSLGITLLNLKTVKIIGFQGSDKEIEVILFVLRNATRLEKMIIERRKYTVLEELLLSFPRCSPNAIVLFSQL